MPRPKKSSNPPPLAPFLALEGIHQLGFSARREESLDQSGDRALNVQITSELHLDCSTETKKIRALAKIRCQAEMEGKEVLAVLSLFRVTYSITKDLPEGMDLPTAAQAFCGQNTLLQVWPYWREFLSRTTLQLGLPALFAPLLVVGQAPALPTAPSMGRKGKR